MKDMGLKGRRKEEGRGNCCTAAVYRTEGKEGAAEIPQPTRQKGERDRSLRD